MSYNRIIYRRFSLLLAVGVLSIFVGCAPGNQALKTPWRVTSNTLAWPLPPDPPRIRYLGAITGDEMGGGRRIWDIIVGHRKIEFGTPHGVSVDPNTLAIADSARAQVHLFDLKRGRYRPVETAGKTFLQCPIGVAVETSIRL